MSVNSGTTILTNCRLECETQEPDRQVEKYIPYGSQDGNQDGRERIRLAENRESEASCDSAPGHD